MNRTHYILLLCISSLWIACSKPEVPTETTAALNIEHLDELETPEWFNYETTERVQFDIELNGPDGLPIGGIPISVSMIKEGEMETLFKIITDEDGRAIAEMELPAYIDEFIISPNYIGIPNNQLVRKNGQRVNYYTDHNGLPLHSREFQAEGEFTDLLLKASSLNYAYLSSYNNQGVPSKMEKREPITNEMLRFINNSLPEGKNVPDFHPSYLKADLRSNVDLEARADVWVTFVHEGAGYKNALCFYTYSTNDPPQSPDEIDSLYVIFPNASYLNGGGGLRSGDRVKIGTFNAGTSIGFSCVSNGWNGSEVGKGLWQLFSKPTLNPVSTNELQQHSILLYDKENELFYVGFEDIRRDRSSCDNDFNDLVFFVKSNPVEAIIDESVAPVDDGFDSDKDGVSDVLDEFPNDPNFAYRNIYPSSKEFGTLAFEDCWPGKGDYDFNDLVLAYQFEEWLSASNEVHRIRCRYSIQAIGASFYHGLGTELPIKPSTVKSVSGTRLFSNSVSLAGNGTENNQSNAVVVFFDNDYSLLSRANGQIFNTLGTKTLESVDTSSIQIDFNTGVKKAELGSAPYNPFIFINGKRGKEVHLPGQEPTDLADTELFQTYHDNTRQGSGSYYKTLNNLPFALHIPNGFDYPLEGAAIHKTYVKFVNWAGSGGTTYKDWFLDKADYRKNDLIYMK